MNHKNLINELVAVSIAIGTASDKSQDDLRSRLFVEKQRLVNELINRLNERDSAIAVLKSIERKFYDEAVEYLLDS